MSAERIGELGSDQKPRQPRCAIGALLEAQELRGPQPEQRRGQGSGRRQRCRKPVTEGRAVRRKRTGPVLGRVDGMGEDAVLRDHREQLAGHVGRELDDAAFFDPDPFAVGAGDADETGEVGFGHAQELRFLPAHDVGPVGPRLGDAGQDADVAGRIDPDGALVQGIEPRRCPEIRRFGPALACARHAADQDRNSLRRAEPGEVIAQHRRKARVGPTSRTMQHAFAAAAFRQRLAIGRHQPAAKAAGAPVDDHEGCGRAARRILSRSQTTTPRVSKAHGRMASPSISTLALGSIRAETWTSVIAGKWRPSVLPHAAPIAAPAALNSAMSVT